MILKGTYEAWRVLEDGTEEWLGRARNNITTPGKNDILNVYFNGTTRTPTWYLGLIDLTNFSGVVFSDTMATHSGWQELQSYAGSRMTWKTSTASGGLITSTASAIFVFNASVNVMGAFCVSDATIGGTTGLLYSTAVFGSPVAFSNGQSFKLNYVDKIVG